jgi:hypothetical protein
VATTTVDVKVAMSMAARMVRKRAAAATRPAVMCDDDASQV